MTHPILYLIHRVQHPNKPLNIARAKQWFAWLVDALPDAVILAPWLVYAECLDEETHRARGMRDGKVLAGLAGISAGIVCGPEISRGCQADIDNLWEHGIPSISLVDLELHVPPTGKKWHGLDKQLEGLVRRIPVMRQGDERLYRVNYAQVPSFTVTC